MRHTAFRTLEVVALPTAVLVAVLLIAPGRAELAVHVYVLVLLAAGLGLVVGAIAESQAEEEPSGFDDALARREDPPERLADLKRLERETALAQSSAFDLHYRLRPVLREVATGLLAVRRGVSLDRQPERARELLGAETWELVRPDREPPVDRAGPGIDTPALRRVVGSLEAL